MTASVVDTHRLLASSNQIPTTRTSLVTTFPHIETHTRIPKPQACPHQMTLPQTTAQPPLRTHTPLLTTTAWPVNTNKRQTCLRRNATRRSISSESTGTSSLGTLCERNGGQGCLSGSLRHIRGSMKSDTKLHEYSVIRNSYSVQDFYGRYCGQVAPGAHSDATQLRKETQTLRVQRQQSLVVHELVIRSSLQALRGIYATVQPNKPDVPLCSRSTVKSFTPTCS